jgi:hypothetical protein
MIGNKRKRIARVPQPRAAMPTFTYAEVETALAKVYDAADVQKTAFRGRLKHFRKLGIPQQQPGKGSRISYTASDVFQLMIACELAEFGVDPSLITKIVKRHWRLKGSLVDAIDYSQRFPGDDFHVAIEATLCLGIGTGKLSAPLRNLGGVIGEPVRIGPQGQRQQDIP